MSKQILLINDMAGYGKVALSAMIPVLSHMRHHIYNLPTALVSNTLDYGKFDILETTDYMEHTMKIWDELGFSFDAVSTGFIVSERQAKLVAEFCRQQSRKGTRIFVDPIMGDEGKLYNGVTEQTISHMKELVKVADYIVPNYTEAACLAGEQYKEDGMTLEEADCLIEKLLAQGAHSIVVTSAVVDHKEAVIVYDYQTKERSIRPFTSIPVRFPGTGDIFSSAFVGAWMQGNTLYDAAGIAARYTVSCIANTVGDQSHWYGVKFETALGELIEALKTQS